MSKNTVGQLIQKAQIETELLVNAARSEDGTMMDAVVVSEVVASVSSTLRRITKRKGSLGQRGPGRIVRSGKKLGGILVTAEGMVSGGDNEFLEISKVSQTEGTAELLVVEEVEEEGPAELEEGPVETMEQSGTGRKEDAEECCGEKMEPELPSVESKSETEEDADSTDLDEEKKIFKETERALRSLSGEWSEENEPLFEFKEKGAGVSKKTGHRQKRSASAALVESKLELERPEDATLKEPEPPVNGGLEEVVEDGSVFSFEQPIGKDDVEADEKVVEDEELTLQLSPDEVEVDLLAPLEVVVPSTNDDDDVENLLRIEQQCATIQSLVARQSLESPSENVEESPESGAEETMTKESDPEDATLSREASGASHNCIALLSPVFSVEVTIDSSKDATLVENPASDDDRQLERGDAVPSQMEVEAIEEHNAFLLPDASTGSASTEDVSCEEEDKRFLNLVVIAPLSPCREESRNEVVGSGVVLSDIVRKAVELPAVEKPVKLMQPKLEPVEPNWSEMEVVETCVVSTDRVVSGDSKVLNQDSAPPSTVPISQPADVVLPMTAASTPLALPVTQMSCVAPGGGIGTVLAPLAPTQPKDGPPQQLRVVKPNFPAPVVVQVSLAHGVPHAQQFAPSFQLHHIQSPQQLQQLQQSLQQHYQLPAQSLSQTLAVQKLATSPTQQLVVAPQQFAISPQQLAAASPQQLTVSLQQLGVSPQQLKVSPHHQQLIVSQLSQHLSQQVTSVATSHQSVNLQQHPLGIASIPAQQLGGIPSSIGATQQKLGLLATPQQLLRMAGVSQHLAQSSISATSSQSSMTTASQIGLVSSLQHIGMITAAQEQLRLASAGGAQHQQFSVSNAASTPQLSASSTTTPTAVPQQVLGISSALQQFVLPNATPQQQQQLRMVAAPLRMIASQQQLGSTTTMQQLMQAISIQQMQLSLNQQLGSTAQQVVLSPVQATQASSVIQSQFAASTPSPRAPSKPILEQPQVAVQPTVTKENSSSDMPPPQMPPPTNQTILAKMSPKDVALKGL